MTDREFDGGIGVIPVSNGAGPVNADGTLPNVKAERRERGQPRGRALEDRRAQGRGRRRGHIKVRGRGLLLASGNSIGQNANQNVFATLDLRSRGSLRGAQHGLPVPLEPNGDFRIDDR